MGRAFHSLSASLFRASVPKLARIKKIRMPQIEDGREFQRRDQVLVKHVTRGEIVPERWQTFGARKVRYRGWLTSCHRFQVCVHSTYQDWKTCSLGEQTLMLVKTKRLLSNGRGIRRGKLILLLLIQGWDSVHGGALKIARSKFHALIMRRADKLFLGSRGKRRKRWIRIRDHQQWLPHRIYVWRTTSVAGQRVTKLRSPDNFFLFPNMYWIKLSEYS